MTAPLSGPDAPHSSAETIAKARAVHEAAQAAARSARSKADPAPIESHARFSRWHQRIQVSLDPEEAEGLAELLEDHAEDRGFRELAADIRRELEGVRRG